MTFKHFTSRILRLISFFMYFAVVSVFSQEPLISLTCNPSGCYSLNSRGLSLVTFDATFYGIFETNISGWVKCAETCANGSTVINTSKANQTFFSVGAENNAYEGINGVLIYRSTREFYSSFVTLGTVDDFTYRCAANVVPFPPPPPVEDAMCEEMEAYCFQEGGIWKGCRRGCFSPILIDIRGDGFSMTDGHNGVIFDTDGNGSNDRISWTSVNSDDAWLALDRNGNGFIENGLELFGNFTAQNPSIPLPDRNGFHALEVFDSGSEGGNRDGVIDQQDNIFPNLRLWIDMNHNAISEPPELFSLPSQGIVAFDLRYAKSKHTDRFGNRFRFRGKVWDSKGGSTGRWAWDVFPVRPQPWN